jgi:hypothetical protein
LTTSRTAADELDRIESVVEKVSTLFSLSEAEMNNETLNMSIRKLLKTVGVASQREIEQAVAKALTSGDLKGTETLPATMTLDIAGLKLNVVFKGEVALQ